MIKINQNSVLKMREPSELLIISSRARKAKAAIGKIYIPKNICKLLDNY